MGDLSSDNSGDILSQRILGVYPQRQEGLYMQRIPVFGGRIDVRRWRAIAETASRFAPKTPLHLTTRQDIEFHNVGTGSVAAVQSELAKAGIFCFGAGGDSVRNITVCPACQFEGGSYDIWPLAGMVRQWILSEPVVLNLPRKFKIAFCGCGRGCVKPFLNDLAFVANRDGSLRVIGAGSLGPKPLAGIMLYEQLQPADAIIVTLSALEMFAEFGDRQNRRTARLRHVRQRLGDEEFCRRLDEILRARRNSITVPKIIPGRGRGDVPYKRTLQFIAGEVPLDIAGRIADYAESNGAHIRINVSHGIELYSANPTEPAEELKKYERRPIIVACPGNTTCKNGLTNCPALAERIAAAIDGVDTGEKIIAISGCGNNCAQSAASDIGLLGCVRTIAGVKQQCYQLFTGGDNGRTDRLARPQEILPEQDLPFRVGQILLRQRP